MSPLKSLCPALAVLAGLAGCDSLPPAAPQLDAAFGQSVRVAAMAQTANPQAGRVVKIADGFDAQSAVSAIARHRASFKAPPPSFTVVGIGGSLTGSD